MLQAFVPVFDEKRSHFFLFVLQLKRQVVEIWDSLAASCQSDWVDRRLHNLVNGCIRYELWQIQDRGKKRRLADFFHLTWKVEMKKMNYFCFGPYNGSWKKIITNAKNCGNSMDLQKTLLLQLTVLNILAFVNWYYVFFTLMKLLVLVACKCNTHVKHGEMKTDGAKCARGSFLVSYYQN